MEELEGKVAVITGAASGIGRALADRFAAEGMKLVVADVEATALDAAVEELRAAGHEVTPVLCDVSVRSQVEGLRDAAVSAYGAVHLVCNNAGVGSGGQMATLTERDWEWVLGVNLWGVIHGVSAFLPLLLAQGEGHIVNTASVAGLFAAPFMGPYNASKYAVVAISETLFNELAMSGTDVGVSVLCPGWVATRIALADRNRPEALRNDEGAADPMSAMRDAFDAFIQGGMAPAAVAEKVCEAVRHKRFYILTHEESKASIDARFRALLDDGHPPMVMP